LLDFANIISSAQIIGFKRVEYLLRSSQLIRNLPIFTAPSDTTGDIKKSLTTFW